MALEKTKRKTKAKGVVTKAKKKTALALAVIRKGSGVVRINKRNLSTMQPVVMRRFVEEPLELAKPLSDEVNIYVTVNGSGASSQAVAARSAIAKALVAYRRDEKLKKRMLAYDRMLLVDDIRKKESKKQLGIGARRKKQKSKR